MVSQGQTAKSGAQSSRRFPFVIHFLIETERIVILSVFHTSRDPEQLKDRR